MATGLHLFSVQALRGFAALSVVVAHSLEHSPGKSADFIISTGRFGVEVFFVISGLVILRSIGAGRFRPDIFIFRRVWRVAPLYWLLTLVVAMLALLAPALFRTTSFDAGYLINSLLFIPSPIPGGNDWRPLYKLGWTLNYEMFFYVLLATTFWCRSMHGRAIAVILILIAFMAASPFFPPKQGLMSYYANLNLLPFLAGVVLALFLHYNYLENLFRIRWFIFVTALIAIVAFYSMPYMATKTTYGHFTMAAAAFGLTLSALAFEDKMASAPVLQWLGDISYSLYLTHMLIIGFGWSLIKKLGFVDNITITSIGILIMIAASLFSAHISYRFLERPLIRLFKRQHIGSRSTTSVHA